MKVSIKKYVATVAKFVENEDGTIKKVVEDITLDGKRFSEATVWKSIPKGSNLVESGWKTVTFEVDTDTLEKFLLENGKAVDNE